MVGAHSNAAVAPALRGQVHRTHPGIDGKSTTVGVSNHVFGITCLNVAACHKGAQQAFAYVGLHLGNGGLVKSRRLVKPDARRIGQACRAGAAFGGLATWLLVPQRPASASAAPIRPRALGSIWAARRLRASVFGYFGHMWELYAFIVLMPTIVASRLAASLMLVTPLPLFFVWLLVWGATVVGDSPQFSTLTAQNARKKILPVNIEASRAATTCSSRCAGKVSGGWCSPAPTT